MHSEIRGATSISDAFINERDRGQSLVKAPAVLVKKIKKKVKKQIQKEKKKLTNFEKNAPSLKNSLFSKKYQLKKINHIKKRTNPKDHI